MDSPDPPSALEQRLREMNQALLLSSLQQHELAAQAQAAEVQCAASNDQLATELTAMQRLQEMSARLIQAGDSDSLYAHIVDAAAGIMHSDMSSMQMLDPGRGALRMLAQHGFGPDFATTFAWVGPDSHTSCALALRSGRRVIVPDVETFAGIAGTPAAAAQRSVGIRASQSTPLFSRVGRLLGMITTHWRSPHEPPQRDLHPMDILARQAADLLERAQSEAALRASEVRYRRLFESAKDGLLILDTQTGKITDANACMGALMETEAHELLGKELWEIGLASDQSASEAAVRELREKGYIRYENLPLESSRGRRVDVEVVANVYTEEHQSVMQCNIRDITERSRLERKTHEQAETLADLHRRKDEFLAMLSHELRNPLAPILNAVHLLRLQREESRLQQRARTIIERQIGQLVHLVNDLLEVSRISTGRIHLQRERLDMRAMVERGVETVRPLIEQRRHTLAVHVPPSALWVDGDSTRLEQVVVNLLNNAAKYTDEGGHIWLGLQQEGTEAVLQVRDSGVGIAPELMPRIFDLFTQAERSLARSQGGLGIGLALVQRLVDMHDGSVAVHSALGQGSEFVVRLPLALTPDAQPPSIPGEAAAPTRASLRVLLVDDNVDAAESLAMLLTESGHSIRMAHDGPTALEAALDYRPNVVLLDIGLPGLDGFEVAERIRKQPTLKNVVLVAMTGYGQETDRQRSTEAGFDHHLVKPVDFDKVQQILATVSEKAP